MSGTIISIVDRRIEKLATKYGLPAEVVEALFLRTPYDPALLERACQRLAGGEELADVYVFIVTERE